MRKSHTIGKAAYEAWQLSAYFMNRLPWHKLKAWEQTAWVKAAQAAIKAKGK